MAYPGGKNGAGVYQTIINLMPPHRAFIEPFLGGGAIMRLKKPAAVNIGIDVDPRVLARFNDGAQSRFRFLCCDALKFLSTHEFSGDDLVYCDPPYMHETRTRKNLYRHEMSNPQHKQLLKIIRTLPCMVMISGYWTKLYARDLASWNSTSFQAVTRSGRMATEWVWFNFPKPVALHDYRYLGKDFRERERIKRKMQRWTHRLERMPMLERRALLHAIELTSPNL